MERSTASGNDVTTEKSSARAPAPLQLEDFLTFRLSVLSNMLDRQSTHMLAENFGLKLAEWRVLACLARFDDMTVRAVVDRIQIDKAQVSRSADSLEAAGYLRRRADPTDGRSVLLAITRKGRSLYERMIPLSRVRQKMLLDHMTEAERKAVFRAIDRLAEHLRENPTPPSLRDVAK